MSSCDPGRQAPGHWRDYGPTAQLGVSVPRSRRREIYFGEKAVGFVGTSARHHELGPIALALVKRNVPTDAQLTVDAMPATQEVVVDPEVGLHVRPRLR